MVQVVIIAIALAVGTGAAASLCGRLMDLSAIMPEITYPFWIRTAGCLVAAVGFMMVFNIHGHGCPLSLIGSVLSWGCFTVCFNAGLSEALSFLPATALGAVYAEGMARVRRCPATPYLVVALLPLIPGGGIYRSVNYAVRGNMSMAVNTALNTAAVAGILAVGILLASTTVRMGNVWKSLRK